VSSKEPVQLAWIASDSSEQTIHQVTNALQVVAVRSGVGGTAIGLGPFAALLPSGELYAELGADRLGALASATRKQFTYFGDLLGLMPGVRLAIVKIEELRGWKWLPRGGVIVLTSRERALLIAGGYVEFQLARQLAEIWFGGGIRVSGPRGRTTELGLRDGLALHWAREFMEPGASSQYLAEFQDAAASRFSQGIVELQLDGHEARALARVALEFCKLLSTPDGRAKAASMTQDWWGMRVPDDEVYRAVMKN
jgi:hypothetical protein